MVFNGRQLAAIKFQLLSPRSPQAGAPNCGASVETCQAVATGPCQAVATGPFAWGVRKHGANEFKWLGFLQF